MTLPDPCSECAPYGGNWIETEAGLKRCDCPRGRALRVVRASEPGNFKPVISTEYATICADIMSAIPFFPAGSGALGAVAGEISAMCESEDQARWLAVRMTRLYDRWPGVAEMRRVFCASYLPLDGVAEIEGSVIYPEGIPSGRPPEPEPLRLTGKPAAGEISAAASIEGAVRDLVVMKDLNRASGPVRVREIPVMRLTDANRITAEQVERAAQEYREQRARVEISLEDPA